MVGKGIGIVSENQQRTIYYLVFFGVLAACVFATYSFYHRIFDIYTDFIGRMVCKIVPVFGNGKCNYLSNNKLVIVDGLVASIHKNFALRYYFFAFVAAYGFFGKVGKSSVQFIFVAACLTLINILKCSMEIWSIHADFTILNDVIIAFRPLCLVILLHFKILHSSVLSDMYTRFSHRLNSKLEINWVIFVCLAILIVPGARIFEFMNLDKMTGLILNISNEITQLGEFHSYVYHNYLILDRNWVYLGKPCLGIGLDMIFIFLVFSIKADIWNKILYSISGVILMLIMNGLRISFLLIHLHKNGGYHLSLEAHDLSNYFFYSVVFVLLLLYIFWLKDVKLIAKK